MRPMLRVLIALLAVVPAAVPAPATGAETPAEGILFPSDRLTVNDARQATGRRLNLPLPDCDVYVSMCHEIRLLNGLDGFDLDPTIAVQLRSAPGENLEEEFDDDTLFVQAVGDGGGRVGLNRFVYDPKTKVLFGRPRDQLRDATTYRVVYEPAGCTASTTFTTLSATSVLAQMRAQLDDGSAYTAAGIAGAEAGLSFVIEGERRVYPPLARIARRNQTQAGQEPTAEEQVLNTAIAGVGAYGFGFFRSPQWLDDDRTIPHTPTRTGEPKVRRAENVGVTLVLPAGPKPEGGWPVAIFGPGITRSKYDVFLGADLNGIGALPLTGDLASRGIATMALDPVGHSFGPLSKTVVQTPAGTDVFTAFGRGFDQNGDGVITDQEGVSAPTQPHPKASIALRDGLRQTAADVMALVRAVERGVDVDGDGSVDLRKQGVSMYAQSLGGIYGTMVAGTDQKVGVAALNVPGGPIVDIARLAPGFRELVANSLRDRQPGLLNGGINQFTESLPLYLDPPVTEPADGAISIQQAFARTNWLNRPGSPESFAPRIRLHPLPDAGRKRVLYQFAHGDETVPNPTSATIMRAGNLADVTSFYRNDRTITRGFNPHGFLLDPRIQGRNQAQLEVLAFIASDGEQIVDPDGPGPTWEVPIADTKELEQRNFSMDKYSDAAGAPPGQPEGREPLLGVSAITRCRGGAAGGGGGGGVDGDTDPPRAVPAGGGGAPTLPATGGGALAVGPILVAVGLAIGARRRGGST